MSTIMVPFSAADLNGADPLAMVVTRLDEASESWALAVAGNVQDSPGLAGPIGRRFAVVGEGGWQLSPNVGDYGVFWNPARRRGFAWANVDRVADFGVGVALCPADCRQTPDGVVGICDLLVLLSRWGEAAGGGPCDVDGEGIIDEADLTLLVGAWGPCQQETSAAPWPAGGSVRELLLDAGRGSPRAATPKAARAAITVPVLLRALRGWGASGGATGAR